VNNYSPFKSTPSQKEAIWSNKLALMNPVLEPHSPLRDKETPLQLPSRTEQNTRSRSLKVDGQAEGSTGCLMDSLTQRRMGMDGCFNFLKSCFEGDSQAKLSN
jgi:hypothetical protein